MGAVESSTGFYNDRKIIQYADGTVDYPVLDAIPEYQVREWQEAEARRLNASRRQEKESSSNTQDMMEKDDGESEQEISPSSIPFDRVAMAHYAFSQSQEKKRLAKLEGVSGSTSSHSMSSSKRSKNEEFEMERLVNDTESSLLESLHDSSFEDEEEKSIIRGNGSWAMWCPQVDCGFISKFRNYRRSRQVHDDETDSIYRQSDLQMNMTMDSV